jgi:hypothetical protein
MFRRALFRIWIDHVTLGIARADCAPGTPWAGFAFNIAATSA